MRKYLQLTRAHTAPLEMTPAIAGAILGTGAVLNLDVALWAVFGLLYHLTGYGMNSYVDWAKGYDKEDENKQHHPLNTGALSEENAKQTVITLFSLTVGWFILIVSSTPEAAIFMILGVASGLAYNYFGKLTELKFLPISVAHSMVFTSAYYATGGRDDFVAFLMTGWVFIWVVYQIAISGEVKDIEQDESNLALRLGSTVNKNGVWFSTEYRFLAVSLKALSVGIGLEVADQLGSSTFTLYLIAGLGGIMVVLGSALLDGGPVVRDRRLNLMAGIEMFMVYLTYIVIRPVTGWPAAIMLSLLATLWVVGFNKVMWGTNLKPDV